MSSRYVTLACASGHCGACQGQNNSECHCKCHDVCKCGHERGNHVDGAGCLDGAGFRELCHCEGFEGEE